jgi:hypothetical protein
MSFGGGAHGGGVSPAGVGGGGEAPLGGASFDVRGIISEGSQSMGELLDYMHEVGHFDASHPSIIKLSVFFSNASTLVEHLENTVQYAENRCRAAKESLDEMSSNFPIDGGNLNEYLQYVRPGGGRDARHNAEEMLDMVTHPPTPPPPHTRHERSLRADAGSVLARAHALQQDGLRRR